MLRAHRWGRGHHAGSSCGSLVSFKRLQVAATWAQSSYKRRRAPRRQALGASAAHAVRRCCRQAQGRGASPGPAHARGIGVWHCQRSVLARLPPKLNLSLGAASGCPDLQLLAGLPRRTASSCDPPAGGAAPDAARTRAVPLLALARGPNRPGAQPTRDCTASAAWHDRAAVPMSNAEAGSREGPGAQAPATEPGPGRAQAGATAAPDAAQGGRRARAAAGAAAGGEAAPPEPSAPEVSCWGGGWSHEGVPRWAWQPEDDLHASQR